MTWVIGMPSMWGYAVGISDIRVSFASGRSVDCLQKIYPVGRSIAAGFAGSVRFGFWAIDDLQRYLLLPPDHAWVPGRAAFLWWRRARRQFAAFPPEERALGASLMLFGASPNKDLGLPGTTLPFVAMLRSPDFFPEVIRLNQASSIGSGADVEVYRASLAQDIGRESEVWRMEVAGFGASAQILKYLVAQTINENPIGSVSPHVHLCLVGRHGISIDTSDRDDFEGEERHEIRMPPVATTWAEFQQLSQAHGLAAADGTA
jgi:hypothetical protein